jgi:hypothetical protein
LATRRRSTPRRTRRRSGFRLPSINFPSVGPEVARSIIGITLLVLGVGTAIALLLPGQGRLTDWWIGSVGPWFGSLRWLLPFLLLGGGWYLEWGPGRMPASGWGMTIVGIMIAYVGMLGAVQITGLWSGGRVGRFLEGLLVAPLTRPGAFVLLVAIGAVGLMLAFNLPLRELVKPGTTAARWLGATAAESIRREPRPAAAGPRVRAASDGPSNERASPRNGGRAGRITGLGGVAPAGQTGIWGNDEPDRIPSGVPSQAPVSATFAPARSGHPGAAGAVAVGEPVASLRPVRDPDDITDASDSPPTRQRGCPAPAE